MENKEYKATKMRCKYCGYEWITVSKLKFVSCPSCLSKNEVKEKLK